MQKLYVEKPGKILAEQYLAADAPPAAGVCLRDDAQPFVAPGVPHVHTEVGVKVLHETDMIVFSAYKPGVCLDVLALAEFEDRFGNVPGAPLPEV